MISSQELHTIVDFFLEKGDLSHLKYLYDMEEELKDDVFNILAKMFNADPYEVMCCSIVAQKLQTLGESELLDGGDGSELKKAGYFELYDYVLTENDDI